MSIAKQKLAQIHIPHRANLKFHLSRSAQIECMVERYQFLDEPELMAHAGLCEIAIDAII